MRIIEIPLSRNKLILGIIGSILFVISGVWLFTHSSDFQNIPFRIFRNPTVIMSVGIAGIIFFGSTGIYGIKKMFDKAIGLTIDENGITDNSNASSVGLIEWNDIVEIRTEQVMSTKLLLIFIANPDFYIDKVKGIKKQLLQGNNKMSCNCHKTSVSEYFRRFTFVAVASKAFAPNRIKPELKSDKVLYLCIKQF